MTLPKLGFKHVGRVNFENIPKHQMPAYLLTKRERERERAIQADCHLFLKVSLQTKFPDDQTPPIWVMEGGACSGGHHSTINLIMSYSHTVYH